MQGYYTSYYVSMLLEIAISQKPFAHHRQTFIHISLSQRYLENFRVTTTRRTMHGRAKLAANIHVCLDFVKILHAIKMALVASQHQRCVAIYIQGIHIGSAHIMQDLSCTTLTCYLNAILPYTTNRASLESHRHTHYNNYAKPFIPRNRI